ncbi:kinase-like domain-containing protein, partial [Cantharellus anzutake]|uniref:kinase-like domain-containing protein n=1 Tax=Cantharellus anzutake TaxID=1750568 RepID=UPI0019039029
FKRETSIWTTLDHPNITPFYGWALEVDFELHPCIVSQYCPNLSASSYLSENPNANRTKIVYEAAEGLSYLHSREVIHGDIKPRNVLINAHHVAMLCDFGLAMALSDQATIPQGSSRYSTIDYTAPELCVATEPGLRTRESDVWSLGCTGMEV